MRCQQPAALSNQGMMQSLLVCQLIQHSEVVGTATFSREVVAFYAAMQHIPKTLV